MSEITTAEELDALPVGSVVRMAHVSDDPPRVALKNSTWTNAYDDPPRTWHYWSVADEEDSEVTSNELDDLPATVLYRPDRPSLPTVQASADAWWQEYSDEAEAHAKLRSGIGALADEWEADEREHEAMAEALADTLDIAATRRDVILRHRRLAHQHASALRALLAEVSA